MAGGPHSLSPQPAHTRAHPAWLSAPTITFGDQRGSRAVHRAAPQFQQGGGLPPVWLRRHRGEAVEYSQSLRDGRISAGHWGSVREVRPAEDLGPGGRANSASASASGTGRWILAQEAQRPSSPLKVCITGLCRAWREEAQSNRCDLKALRARGRSSQGQGIGTHTHVEDSPPADSCGGVLPARPAWESPRPVPLCSGACRPRTGRLSSGLAAPPPL